MLKVDKIKELMEKRGLMQKDLAEAAGVTPGFICQMLNGSKVPGPVPFSKIATTLGVTMEDLVG